MNPTETLALISIPFLLYAAWSDHRTRTVPDWLWILALLPALPLTMQEAMQDPATSWNRLLTFTVLTILMVPLYASHSLAGADVKGTLALTLITPPIVIASALALAVGLTMWLVHRRGEPVAFYPHYSFLIITGIGIHFMI